MALNTQFSDTLVDAMANAFTTLFAGAKMAVINSTGVTSNEGSTSGQTQNNGVILATFQMGTPAFGAPTSGVIVANAIATVAAVATGTANMVRFVKSDFIMTESILTPGSAQGANPAKVLMDCTAGTSNANLIISPITNGTNVSIGSFTHEVTNAFSGQ